MRLKISSDELLLDLESGANGMLQYHYVKGSLQTAVFRWTENGIDEEVQDGPEWYDTHLEITPSDNPKFLLKLKIYLERQFDFIYELTEEVSNL